MRGTERSRVIGWIGRLRRLLIRTTRSRLCWSNGSRAVRRTAGCSTWMGICGTAGTSSYRQRSDFGSLRFTWRPISQAMRPAELDRIYEAAVRFAPTAISVRHSHGISAKHVAKVAEEPKVTEKYRDLSFRCLTKADELLPDDADILYSLGAWHYDFREPASALPFFERAIRVAPPHGFARLYLAHCLHDMERWHEAVAAYGNVPLDAFKGPTAWRIDAQLEAQAHCKLHVGDRQGAIIDFTRLLDRLEKHPARAQPLTLEYLRNAATGDLASDIGVRYAELAKLIEKGLR